MSHPNDPKLKSFIDVDSTSDFPIQNLPYGVFSTPDSVQRRVGVAIGDFVLDLAVLESEGLLKTGAERCAFAKPSLNAFMALGPKAWSSVRAQISELLRHDSATLRDNGLKVLDDGVILKSQATLAASLTAEWDEAARAACRALFANLGADAARVPSA